MTVAERVFEILASLGVRRAYGLPGEDHLSMLAALSKAGIEYHAAFNETSSVIMAATDSRISGVPGIAILSMAPGISNGLNGILHAFMEGLPVIIFSGQWQAARVPLVVRQGFDSQDLLRPVTKWTGAFRTNSDPTAILAKAIDTALAPQPGPVYLELSEDVASSESDVTDTSTIEVLRQRTLGQATCCLGPSPAESTVDEVAHQLAQAERPALIVGGRCQTVSRETVQALATAFRLPVFTSSGQKGLVTGGFQYFAGTFLNGNLERRILDASDFILAVNPEAYDYYNTRWPNPDKTTTISCRPLGEWLFAFSDRLVSDPDTLLSRAAAAAPAEVRSRWTADDVVEYRAYVRAELLADQPTEHLSVATAVDEALRSSPPGCWVVADAGFSKPLVALLSEVSERGRFLASNALSTMGFAVPGALGARLAGAHPILAFTGDGSLLMRVSELASAGGSETGPVVVAIVDGSLSQIQIKQERRGLAPLGVQLPRLSCERLGAAFGIKGVDVTDPQSLKAAMDDAFSSGECVLVGAHVQPDDSRRIFDLLRG